jgi:hypothetical protein
VADSFFARREILSVFNAGRGDAPYLKLDVVSKPVWEQGFQRNALLKSLNHGFPKQLNGQLLIQISPEVETARVYALLLRAMESEWEQTNTSHEVSRQLMFSSGLLPRNVHVPEWIGFGMGSFFESPLQSPWQSTAAPNAYWLPRFKEYQSAGKYESSEQSTLIKVVTDAYFRGKAPLGDKATTAQRAGRPAPLLQGTLAHAARRRAG